MIKCDFDFAQSPIIPRRLSEAEAVEIDFDYAVTRVFRKIERRLSEAEADTIEHERIYVHIAMR